MLIIIQCKVHTVHCTIGVIGAYGHIKGFNEAFSGLVLYECFVIACTHAQLGLIKVVGLVQLKLIHLASL